MNFVVSDVSFALQFTSPLFFPPLFLFSQGYKLDDPNLRQNAFTTTLILGVAALWTLIFFFSQWIFPFFWVRRQFGHIGFSNLHTVMFFLPRFFFSRSLYLESLLHPLFFEGSQFYFLSLGAPIFCYEAPPPPPPPHAPSFIR